jgi:hypothetical protein
VGSGKNQVTPAQSLHQVLLDYQYALQRCNSQRDSVLVQLPHRCMLREEILILLFFSDDIHVPRKAWQEAGHRTICQANEFAKE